MSFPQEPGLGRWDVAPPWSLGELFRGGQRGLCEEEEEESPGLVDRGRRLLCGQAGSPARPATCRRCCKQQQQGQVITSQETSQKLPLVFLINKSITCCSNNNGAVGGCSLRNIRTRGSGRGGMETLWFSVRLGMIKN